jgi:hypothetical protein
VASSHDGNSQRNDKGGFYCPKCGGAVVPMRGKATGKGWNCAKHPYAGYRGSDSCQGTIWNRSTSSFQQFSKKTERAKSWPNIRNRTEQQIALREALAKPPGKNRMKSADASAGTGKTTSSADNCEVVYHREKAYVSDLHICAFNVNARTSLESKFPAEWQNVTTINSFGARAQGFKFKQYKLNKIGLIFKDLVSHMAFKERPRGAGIKAFADRFRDSCLYNDDTSDKSWWNGAIDTIAARFPALGKVLAKKENEQVIREYLPQILTIAARTRDQIDLTEQYTFASTDASRRIGWKMPFQMLERNYQWTDADCAKFCDLIRAINVPNQRFVTVDEAQDLSLSQIALFLASTYKSGELVLVGDDRLEDENGEIIKVGQAIFGWRGAFPGSMKLVERLWKMLTGEEVKRFPLSISFRCPPEVCNAVRPLNKIITSNKPIGSGEVFSVSVQQAFSRWLAIDESTETALWITRRNAPLAPLFMETLRERKKVCLRGGSDMNGAVSSALYEAAGYYDEEGEFKTSLRDCLIKLREASSQVSDDEENPSSSDGDSMEAFLLTIGEEIQKDPLLLKEAELEPVATVGNLRRFVLYFADKSAPRVLSTVYRSKGDEADVVIVDDTEMLNMAWNNDEHEAEACRFVAATRSKRTLLVIGELNGVIADNVLMDEGHEMKLAVNQNPSVKPISKPITEVKPVAEPIQVKPVDLFGDEVTEQPVKKTRRRGK